MAKHTRHKVNEDGWTEWIYPHMNDYRLSCCDCGLTHSMDFKIVNVERLPDNTMIARNVQASSLAVAYRAKTHVQSTAQIRRWKNKK